VPQRGRLRGFSAKTRDAKLKLLQAIPLFSACNKRDLSRIASLVDEVEVPSGRVLMRQGENGRECFVIAEGKAKATLRGRRSVTLGPGAVIGEISLLDHGPRSATVTAETDMHLLVLTSREFFSLLDAVPGVSQRIMRALAERVRAGERPQPQH
jgi:CRP/FNR family cyclic AMP-dependent transcriptional regulator